MKIALVTGFASFRDRCGTINRCLSLPCQAFKHGRHIEDRLSASRRGRFSGAFQPNNIDQDLEWSTSTGFGAFGFQHLGDGASPCDASRTLATKLGEVRVKSERLTRLGAPRTAGKKRMVKVPRGVKTSHPPRPRVMRRVPERADVERHRGDHRPSIELRTVPWRSLLALEEPRPVEDLVQVDEVLCTNAWDAIPSRYPARLGWRGEPDADRREQIASDREKTRVQEMEAYRRR